MAGIIILLLLISLFIYFSPTIVAASRQKQNVMAIGILNLFLGWTFIGWVVALVWAFMEEK